MRRATAILIFLALVVALPTAWGGDGKKIESLKKDLKSSNLKSSKKRSKYAKALDSLEKMIEEGLEGDDASAAMDLYVESAFRFGDFPKVVDRIDAALEGELDDERRWEYQLRKGQSLMKMIRFDAAEEVLSGITEGPKAEDAEKSLKMLDQMRNLKPEIGKPAPDFSFRSVDGRVVTLSQLRGKVVIVDFWAVWCGPCKAEMPNVIETYKKYHPYGFEIVGISLDTDKSSLESYTKDNEMTWAQYFDGLRWDNMIAKYYGVRGIPAMYLIDKNGIIAAQKVRGNALPTTVEKLLRQK